MDQWYCDDNRVLPPDIKVGLGSTQGQATRSHAPRGRHGGSPDQENVCQILTFSDLANPESNDHRLYEAANTIARLRKLCRNNKKTPEGKAMAKRADHLWEAAVDLSSLTRMRRCNPPSTSITISPIQVNDAVDRLARSQRLAVELLLVLLETGWRKSYQRRTKFMRLHRSLRRRTKSLRTSKRALVSRRASRRAKR